MCDSTVVKELPETSYWHGKLSEEEVRKGRESHHALVEEWLDFCDFATELFKLHEKYGIAKGEAGYAAYRKYLKKGYDQKLASGNGPIVDPLDEGCQCIYCKMHPKEEPDVSPAESRLGQVPAESPNDCIQANNHQQAIKNQRRNRAVDDDDGSISQCGSVDGIARQKKAAEQIEGDRPTVVMNSMAKARREMTDVAPNCAATHVPRSSGANEGRAEIYQLFRTLREEVEIRTDGPPGEPYKKTKCGSEGRSHAKRTTSGAKKSWDVSQPTVLQSSPIKNIDQGSSISQSLMTSRAPPSVMSNCNGERVM